MKRAILALCPLLIATAAFYAQAEEFPPISGDYLGQKPPGEIPELFAPGIISTGSSEGCSGWGKRMEFFIFQRWIDRKSRIYVTRNENGLWTRPEMLPFVEEVQPGDFTLAPDGSTLVFASNILIPEIGSEGEGGNIWSMERTATGWTKPRQLGKPINSRYHDSYPSLAANGNLYFFSRKPGGHGASDLYFSEYQNGRYQEPVNLGNKLNTPHHEWDPYVAPDESYMVFCSMKPGGLGEDDLYVAFRHENGAWGEPVHLGNGINSEKSDNRPYVTPDGKYLFYVSARRGTPDIFWVDARVLAKYRKAKEP